MRALKLNHEPTVYEDALIILNEGAFTGGTATLDAVGGNADTVVQSPLVLKWICLRKYWSAHGVGRFTSCGFRK